MRPEDRRFGTGAGRRLQVWLRRPEPAGCICSAGAAAPAATRSDARGRLTPHAVALRSWLLLMESSSVVSLADIARSPGEAGGRSGRGSLFQLVRTRSEVSVAGRFRNARRSIS